MLTNHKYEQICEWPMTNQLSLNATPKAFMNQQVNKYFLKLVCIDFFLQIVCMFYPKLFSQVWANIAKVSVPCKKMSQVFTQYAVFTITIGTARHWKTVQLILILENMKYRHDMSCATAYCHSPGQPNSSWVWYGTSRQHYISTILKEDEDITCGFWTTP